jgi:hypothetical protein
MKDESQVNPDLERKLDSLLASSYPPGPALSRDFESNVMAAIARERRSRGSRFVLLTMMAYWAVASLCGALLLSGMVPAGGRPGGQLAVILAVLALIFAAAMLMVRPAGLKLSDLFLRTIIH